MHIVVDGYNLIRQSSEFRRFEQRGLEAGRKYLIERLSLYKKVRGHAITVVFDGWDRGPSTEERTREKAITIIFSRRGEKADDVIRRMASQEGKTLLIVTSDRDLAYAAARFGATIISSHRFEENLIQADFGSFTEKEDPEKRTVSSTKKKGPSKKIPKYKRANLSKLTKL